MLRDVNAQKFYQENGMTFDQIDKFAAENKGTMADMHCTADDIKYLVTKYGYKISKIETVHFAMKHLGEVYKNNLKPAFALFDDETSEASMSLSANALVLATHMFTEMYMENDEMYTLREYIRVYNLFYNQDNNHTFGVMTDSVLGLGADVLKLANIFGESTQDRSHPDDGPIDDDGTNSVWNEEDTMKLCGALDD